MIHKMSKKNVVIAAIIVLLVVAIGGYILLGMNKKGEGMEKYYIVYLTSGEVYVGKLQTFPVLRLKDAYLFQVIQDTTDPKKNNFQLNPLSEGLWSTEYLQLTRENILFYGPLLNDSKISQALLTKTE